MFLFYDIGGTNTRIGISHDGSSLDEQYTFETETDYKKGFEKLINQTKVHIDIKKVKTIIAGLPGNLSEDKSFLQRSPHLPNWENQNFNLDLKKYFECPIYLENDTALVGLGEAIFGAGKGSEIVGYITISTGVGGVRIENGKIDANRYGFEIGHQHIKDNLTLEELVSGTVISQKYNMHPRDILDEKVWNEYTDDLALGISNMILFWSPDIIVVGGSMSRSVLFERLEKKVEDSTDILKKIPRIVKSELDTVGGLYGGLAYIQNINKENKNI